MKKSIILAAFVFAVICAQGAVVRAQTYAFNTDLSLGSTGQDVVNLQSWLVSNGYDIPSISSGASSEGYFGLQTQAAVEAYQRAIGLPAYGFFGPMTRAYWSSHYGNGGNKGVSNGQTPVISGIDAPTSLAVGQTGTWTVHATDPLNETLNYSVDWGDVVNPTAAYVSGIASPQFNQSTTFTHVYSSAGTYTVTFTVRNNSGLEAQSSATVVVGSGNIAGSLRIVSPNGGEVWNRGTNQQITWTSPYYFAAAYADLKLVPYQAPCTTNVCSMLALAPYTIATNIPINQNSYSWNVGTAMNYSNVSQSVPDGRYSIQICQSGTSTCDSSDSTFTITSAQTSNLPDINIISPNGGETWKIGTSQPFTVNITGDPSKVGPFVTASLVNSANQETIVYVGTQAVAVGIQAFNAFVQQTVLPGSYRLIVRLYQTFPTTAGTASYPTSPAPTLQAYDYSDNYFTVTN
ncbi:MAG: peptidoglycan-binding protein [Candidatus Pacebacteria bacterium]|nr:peptidoglycan-binding protein [Candidatus Paceibacterota bacterium]